MVLPEHRCDNRHRLVASLMKAGLVFVLLLTLCCKTGFANQQLSPIFKQIEQAVRMRDYQHAIALLKPLAAQEDSQACYKLATFYRNGLGVKRDDKIAVKYFQCAAEKNHAKAQYNLGKMFEHGWGVERNRALANKWFKKAADNGHLLAKKKMAVKKTIFSAEKQTVNNASIQQVFRHAVNKQDIELAEHSIQQGAAVDKPDRFGQTALMDASQQGREKVVRWLLGKGARTEIKNHFGETALALAVKNGQENIVKLLLQNGANANTKDRQGNTALHLAVSLKSATILEWLLKNQSKVNLVNNKGMTPLDIAESRHIERYSRLLRQYHAKRSQKKQSEHTVSLSVLSSLTDDKEKSNPLYKSWTPLMIAVQHGDLVACKKLLDAGVAEINKQNDQGNTALLIAADLGNDKIVQLLVHHGAKYSQQNNSKETALLLAAKKGHRKVVKQLLAIEDIKLDTQDKTGNSPLLWSIINQHPSISKALIQAGAKLNLVNKEKETALILVVKNKDMQTLKQVLSKKVDIHAHDRQQASAFWYAVDENWLQGAKLLQKQGANIMQKDISGFSPLARASYRGNQEMVHFLLQWSEHIDTKTNEGNTPLMLAVLSDCLPCARLLLENGAHVDEQNKMGDTALLIAIRKENLPMVNLLLEHKANTLLRNYQKQNAIILAKQLNNQSLIKLLDAFSIGQTWIHHLLKD